MSMNLIGVAMLDSNNLVLSNINGSDVTVPQYGIVKFQLTFDAIDAISMTDKIVNITRPDGYTHSFDANGDGLGEISGNNYIFSYYYSASFGSSNPNGFGEGQIGNFKITTDEGIVQNSSGVKSEAVTSTMASFDNGPIYFYIIQLVANNSSYYFTTTTQYNNYYETDDLINFSLTAGSSGTLTFTPLVTTTNTDISLCLVISGGGGGGASSGQNYGGGIESMSWGSGSGGGGAGFGKIILENISTSYNYTVGSGGVGGIGSQDNNYAQTSGGNGGNSSFNTSYGNIVAGGGGGAPSIWIDYEPVKAGTAGTLTYPSNPDIIAINDCSGGNGGLGVQNDESYYVGVPTPGSKSTPIQTIEVYDSYTISIGGGGGGGNAGNEYNFDRDTMTWTEPKTSNNAGKPGLNGIGGQGYGPGALIQASGGDAITYGAGGGGAGQAGISDSPYSNKWQYWYNNGGYGGNGIIYITFLKPPVVVSITDGSVVYSNNSIIYLQEGSQISFTSTTITTATLFTQTTSLNFVELNSTNGNITINSNVSAGNYTFSFYCENSVGKSNTFNLNISVLSSSTTSTIFTKTDLTTLTSYDTVITQSSYSSLTPDPSEIKSVQIGTNVTEIGNNAFQNASNLNSVIFDSPSSVTIINVESFQNTSALSSVIIPSSVTYIGGGAFQVAGGGDPPAPGLASVTIPSSVNTIGEYAFSGISNLETVTIYTSAAPADGSQMFFKSNNIKTAILDFSGPIANNILANRSMLTSVTLLNVTSIGPFSFATTSALTSINIPNTVTDISDSAFESSGLTSITIPASVTTIGDEAFKNCQALITITFESNSNPSSMSTTTFDGNNITVYMNSNTLDYLNNHYALSPALKNDSNYTQLFFGATNVAINSTDPTPTPEPTPEPAPEPAPIPTPIPPPISNRPGPIQFCTSRFAKCNLNNKTRFSSGNVTIQGSTNSQRISLMVEQGNRRGAKLVTSNQPLNQFGRRAGGPGGFGAPPKNQF